MIATRPTLIFLNGACLAVALLAWPSIAESPMAAARPAGPADVTVEHQLIRITKAPAVAPRLSPRPAYGRQASREPAQSIKPATLGTRAGRLLFGDGRHRPEPFPRPGR